MKQFKNLAAIVLVILSIYQVAAQVNEDYIKYTEQAFELYQKKDFLESGKMYSKAFAAFGGMGSTNDRYNAACSWALAKQSDSAFIQLFKIATTGNDTDYTHIINDTDLKSLYSDSRWEEIIKLVKKNKDKAEENLDKYLMAILDTIYQEDQKYRIQLDEIEKQHGRNSDEEKVHWKIINEKDSINLIKVKKILDERGWLGSDIIGQQGNSTLYLVIQHSDLATQEKYLPIMKEAVSKGGATPSDFAFLVDRVSLRQGKRQIYGSQIGRDQVTGEFYVLPLENPDSVDIRRKKVV